MIITNNLDCLIELIHKQNKPTIHWLHIKFKNIFRSIKVEFLKRWVRVKSLQSQAHCRKEMKCLEGKWKKLKSS